MAKEEWSEGGNVVCLKKKKRERERERAWSPGKNVHQLWKVEKSGRRSLPQSLQKECSPVDTLESAQ